MGSATFRSAPAPEVATSSPDTFVPNEAGSEGSYHDVAPIEVLENEGKDVLLNALGIDDRINNIPEDGKENHTKTKDYVLSIIKSRGLSPTQETFNYVLNDVRYEFGLSNESDPQTVLERIGGVVDAWKNLSFIKNPQEKRQVFMKLAKAQSSSDMNRMVFEEMERRKVWQ